MKKTVVIVFMLIVSILFSIPVYAQSAKEAIYALKKLEARVEAGISYRDYSPALGETKFPVNLYLESKEAVKHIKLTKSISMVMTHYENAGTYWHYKFSIWKYGVSKDSQQEIIKIYPEAGNDAIHNNGALTKEGDMYVDFLLPVVWREASKELANASNLYSQTENESSNEIESIKKENAKLKKQLESMKAKKTK